MNYFPLVGTGRPEPLKSYSIEKSGPYQPKTGAACGCKPGDHRDNCPNCEGTGMVIDFAAIRRAR